MFEQDVSSNTVQMVGWVGDLRKSALFLVVVFLLVLLVGESNVVGC